MPTPGSPSYTHIHTHTHTHTHTPASSRIPLPLLASRGCLGTSGVRDRVLWGASWGCWCVTPPGAQALGTTCRHLALAGWSGSRGGGWEGEALNGSSTSPSPLVSHWQGDKKPRLPLHRINLVATPTPAAPPPLPLTACRIV